MPPRLQRLCKERATPPYVNGLSQHPETLATHSLHPPGSLHHEKPSLAERPCRLSHDRAGRAGLERCDSDSVDTTTALRSKVKNVVVIYAENRSFDGLYGNFPGANGISSLYDANGKLTSAYVVQKDRNGTALATLPRPGAV